MVSLTFCLFSLLKVVSLTGSTLTFCSALPTVTNGGPGSYLEYTYIGDAPWVRIYTLFLYFLATRATLMTVTAT